MTRDLQTFGEYGCGGFIQIDINDDGHIVQHDASSSESSTESISDITISRIFGAEKRLKKMRCSTVSIPGCSLPPQQPIVKPVQPVQQQQQVGNLPPPPQVIYNLPPPPPKPVIKPDFKQSVKPKHELIDFIDVSDSDSDTEQDSPISSPSKIPVTGNKRNYPIMSNDGKKKKACRMFAPSN